MRLRIKSTCDANLEKRKMGNTRGDRFRPAVSAIAGKSRKRRNDSIKKRRVNTFLSRYCSRFLILSFLTVCQERVPRSHGICLLRKSENWRMKIQAEKILNSMFRQRQDFASLLSCQTVTYAVKVHYLPGRSWKWPVM